MKYFNIPADFKTATVDAYERLNDTYHDSKVIETYGQITVNNAYGSGRPSDLIPKIDLNALEKYVNYSRKKGIDFNYTLNAICLSNKEFTEEGMTEFALFLKTIYEMGISSITVAIPSLIEHVKKSKYPFTIKASVLCEIVNANKAVSYQQLGADKVVLYEPINREFDNLKNIRKAFGPNTEVIVNVICHKNCIYRPFHQNQCSHDLDTDTPSVTYYAHKCMEKRVEEVGNLLRLAWIRPEDIKHYTRIGIEYFKLQGRHTAFNGDPARAVECYMKEEFDGNLMDLLDLFAPTNSFNVHLDNKSLDGFIKPFLENPQFCKESCGTCSYCDNFVKKALDYAKSRKVFDVAQDFYSQYDQYTNMLQKNSISPEKEEKNTTKKTKVIENDSSLQFDFE